MEIHENDVLVIPEDMIIPEDFPYKFHRIKYLYSPSIVCSGAGFMANTMTSHESKGTSFLSDLLALLKPKTVEKEYKDIFFRHIRILNSETSEFYHNRGGSVLIDLRAEQGRFFFSFATCNHQDNFNKMIANRVCQERMSKGYVFECINYDPSISILQNIFLAIGVMDDMYPLTEYDWKDILPELFGNFTEEQKNSLRTLRRLIRDKSNY